MRSFVALPIAEPTVAALVALQSEIPIGRPVSEGNLHLTLAFLGEVDGAAMEELHLTLGAIRVAPVEITFDGLDSFTEMDRGLVFAAVRKTAALDALQAAVARAARGAGIDLPRRRFRPHVTLTRANRRPDGIARDRLAAMLGAGREPPPGFAADRFCLYSSELLPTGARHEMLAEYPLVQSNLGLGP